MLNKREHGTNSETVCQLLSEVGWVKAQGDIQNIGSECKRYKICIKETRYYKSSYFAIIQCLLSS